MPEQNLKNHARMHPVYHFFVVPVLLANAIAMLVGFARHPTLGDGWAVLVAVALLTLGGLLRTYALTVQDRVILLEQRIRMAALLPMESRALQAELNRKQLIALRFASDAELASLAERAAREKLAPRAIKEQIREWRPDTHRV